ncbi:hypothetical protein ASF60_22270 [Methylobacterium sp. Leaf113]|nr:hypothetical protein ASF60_22270 [Methylobacterium sp. Leaf113]
MVELIAGEIARASAGEAYIGAAAYRRLSQALEPHSAALALSLCQGGEVRSDGTVGIVVPRNFAIADANLDPQRSTFRVSYDPRSGEWSSEASAGEDGFDGFCAHVWRIQGRSEGMAARDLLAFIGAAYLALLAEGPPA